MPFIFHPQRKFTFVRHSRVRGKSRKSVRKHTPIVSVIQHGMFGAELARRKKGLTPRMPEITVKELREHLKESKGKKLPKKVKRRKK